MFSSPLTFTACLSALILTHAIFSLGACGEMIVRRAGIANYNPCALRACRQDEWARRGEGLG